MIYFNWFFFLQNIDAQINNFKKGGLQSLMATGKKCTYILLNLALTVLQSYVSKICVHFSGRQKIFYYNI